MTRARSRSRLQRLEAARVSPITDAVSRASIDAQYPWMAPGATIMVPINAVAMNRGRRRAIAEGAYCGYGYYPEPVEARIRVELVALDDRWASTGDLMASLAAWCDEPDQDGWPPCPPDGPVPTEPASVRFWERFREERTRLDGFRASGEWSAWREAHPEWMPDMTADEYLAWDLAPLVPRGRGREGES